MIQQPSEHVCDAAGLVSSPNKRLLPQALNNAFMGVSGAGVEAVTAVACAAAAGAEAIDWAEVEQGEVELGTGRWLRVSDVARQGRCLVVYGPDGHLLLQLYPSKVFGWATPLLTQLFCTLFALALLHRQEPKINCFACAQCKARHRACLASNQPFAPLNLDKVARLRLSFHLSLWARLVRHRNGGTDEMTGALFVQGGRHGALPVHNHSLRELGVVGYHVVDRMAVYLEAVEMVVWLCLPHNNAERLASVPRSMGALAELPGRLWSSLIMVWHSETGIHLDTGNLPNLLTGLATVGEFKGGDFVLLELGLVLKCRPGAFLFFKSGDLMHLNLPLVRGWRGAVNLSTDKAFSCLSQASAPRPPTLSLANQPSWQSVRDLVRWLGAVQLRLTWGSCLSLA